MTVDPASLLLIIGGTAVASSLLTLAIVAGYYEHRVKPRLERELAERMREAEEKLGTLIRDKVRQGVLDAVASIPSTGTLKEAQKTVLRTAADLVEGGLAALWGEGPKREEE
jgi:hypothetical protein